MDSKKSPVHPYTVVKEDTSEFFFAQKRGLPGYHPPIALRVFNAITFFAVAFLLVSLAYASAVSGFHESVSIPGTDGVQAGHVVLTAAVAYGILILFAVTVVTKVSNRYEERHIRWLEEIRPNNPDGPYPLDYWYAVKRDEEGFEFPDPPRTAPPELRDLATGEQLLASARHRLHEAASGMLQLTIFASIISFTVFGGERVERYGQFRDYFND